ncbi:hypothetical protein ACFQX7_02965 [Luedemannella flava]
MPGGRRPATGPRGSGRSDGSHPPEEPSPSDVSHAPDSGSSSSSAEWRAGRWRGTRRCLGARPARVRQMPEGSSSSASRTGSTPGGMASRAGIGGSTSASARSSWTVSG